jgi:hypothetical protein
MERSGAGSPCSSPNKQPFSLSCQAPFVIVIDIIALSDSFFVADTICTLTTMLSTSCRSVGRKRRGILAIDNAGVEAAVKVRQKDNGHDMSNSRETCRLLSLTVPGDFFAPLPIF